jgi:hypothetical protein
MLITYIVSIILLTTVVLVIILTIKKYKKYPTKPAIIKPVITKPAIITPAKNLCKNVKCVNGVCDPKDGKCYKLGSFKNVEGLSGQGFCYAEKNNFPYYKIINNKTLDECKALCSQDKNCPAISYNKNNSQCIVHSFSSKGNIKASTDWKPYMEKRFPTYASPWYGCPVGKKMHRAYENIPGTYCRPLFPGSCANAKTGPVTGVSCWKKVTKREEHYEDPNKVLTAPEDDVHCQVVVSDPFIPSYNLIWEKNSFYEWVYDLINEANKYITIVNVYITLGQYKSDDPEDYQSAIHIALLKALKRGVIVYFVSWWTDQTYCQAAIRQQPGFAPYLKNKTLRLINTGFFFHDKLYISDQKAYIGGQNFSGSSSVDFGISFSKDSPLYPDLLQRSEYFASKGQIPLNFKYTADNPFIARDGTKYFIALSPVYPICWGKQPGHNPFAKPKPTYDPFPQNACDFSQAPVGPYANKANSKVSYEWNHIINLIKNARKFLRFTSYDWSFFGDILSEVGYDQTMADVIMEAADRGVEIDFWFNGDPFTETVMLGSATCDFNRCQQGKAYIEQLKTHKNVKIHWWYQRPAALQFSQCYLLHAKIYYSDWGILVSSSNFTPNYFGSTSDTGFCAIYDGKIPEWISTGLENTFNILNNHKTVKSWDRKKTFLCDNTEPNFQIVNQDGKPACRWQKLASDPTGAPVYLCYNACMRCNDPIFKGTYKQRSCGICGNNWKA